MLRLSALYRYPLKSGKGEILQQVSLDKLGLDGDRRWMLVDEASGRFLTQRAVAQMSQLSALWNADGGLTLSAPGRSPIDIALPASEAELRGVTIWRDTLRVPDAGDGRVPGSVNSLANRLAWSKSLWIAHGPPRPATARTMIRWPSPMAFRCC